MSCCDWEKIKNSTTSARARECLLWLPCVLLLRWRGRLIHRVGLSSAARRHTEPLLLWLLR